MKENITSTITFPHSCAWCQRYYPKSDRNNVMKGGGECWSWSRIRGGDCAENQCCDFEPMEERCIVQKAMYVVKAVSDDDGMMMVFEDSFLHSVLMSVDCDSLHEGISMLMDRMTFWDGYFGKCVEMLPTVSKAPQEKSAKKKKQEAIEMNSIQNPNSPVRKRFNTILRGFPRNIQTAYKPDSESGSIRVRLYNTTSGISSMEIWDDDSARFTTVGKYCSNEAKRRLISSSISAEFSEYSKFIKFFASELEK